MLEVGQRVENKGNPFTVLELFKKKAKIQFIESHFIKVVAQSQVHGAAGTHGYSAITDPMTYHVLGVGRKGASSLKYPNDRKNRALQKAIDRIWRNVLEDYRKGIKVIDSWLTRSNFEIWFYEQFQDRWKEFVEFDMKLLPLGGHGSLDSVLVDHLTYKLWQRQRGVFLYGNIYQAMFNGKVVGKRRSRTDALTDLLNHVKTISDPVFAHYISKCVYKLEKELCSTNNG